MFEYRSAYRGDRRFDFDNTTVSAVLDAFGR
jgi:hypothetical protein